MLACIGERYVHRCAFGVWTPIFFLFFFVVGSFLSCSFFFTMRVNSCLERFFATSTGDNLIVIVVHVDEFFRLVRVL